MMLIQKRKTAANNKCIALHQARVPRSSEMCTIPLSFCLMPGVGDLHNPVNIVNTKPTPSPGQKRNKVFKLKPFVCLGLDMPDSDISDYVSDGQQTKIL